MFSQKKKEERIDFSLINNPINSILNKRRILTLEKKLT